MKLISYVLPVYNEEAAIDKFYLELTSQVSKLQKSYRYEFIFVNDGSKDSSLEKLLSIHQQDPRVKVINFSRNFGHQRAVTAGIDFAKGDAVILMDTDLQDPPSVSLELISKWEEGYEVVYAQRRKRQDTFMKKFTATLFYRILDWFSEVKIPRETGDFRLMDRKVVDVFCKFREQNRYVRGLVSYIGFRQLALPFDRDARFAGKTGYSFGKMLRLALDAITSFSSKPISFVWQLGCLVTTMGAMGLGYLLVRQFVSHVEISSDWWLAVLVTFLGGMQMIAVGIAGAYIGRIYKEVQDRPLYIVSEIYDQENEKTKASNLG